MTVELYSKTDLITAGGGKIIGRCEKSLVSHLTYSLLSTQVRITKGKISNTIENLCVKIDFHSPLQELILILTNVYL